MSKYIGATVVNLSVDTVDVTGDITATDATPEVIIVNDTHEDTDGGREGKVTFKGQQSGGEETTLAQIQASHDGTADDEKGDLIFKTNDGSDGASPTEAMRIDSTQKIGIGINAPAFPLDVSTNSSTTDDAVTTLRLSANTTGTAANNFGAAINFSGEDASGSLRDLATINSIYTDATNRSSAITFKTRKTLGSLTERVRIDADGNVGIGDTSPESNTNFTALTVTSTASTGGGQVYVQSSSVTGVFGADNATDAKTIVQTNTNHPLVLGTNNTERVRINADGNVGIGTDTIDVSTQAGGSGYKALQIESDEGGQLNFDHNDAGTGSTLGQINFQRAGEVVAEIEGVTDGATDNGRLAFRVQPDGGALTEAMRIDHNGTLLVGKTTDSAGTAGFKVEPEGDTYITAEGADGRALYLNRLTSDDTIIELAKDNTTVGKIGSVAGSYLFIGEPSAVGISFISDRVRPATDGTNTDDTYDFGHPTVRWDDIYATNSSIQTSDENEKQNIASLTSAEITAATAISKLFKTYKWKSKVTAKGDNARTHTGVVAQQIQTAMSDAGLDAGNYAFFISSTWWEKDVEVAAVEANEEKLIKAQDAYTRTDIYDTKNEAPEGATERTRLGIRYPELLAFIGAATEQRLTSIEARLTALEGE